MQPETVELIASCNPCGGWWPRIVQLSCRWDPIQEERNQIEQILEQIQVDWHAKALRLLNV